jgi:hypothetical protein
MPHCCPCKGWLLLDGVGHQALCAERYAHHVAMTHGLGDLIVGGIEIAGHSTENRTYSLGWSPLAIGSINQLSPYR